jgi:uncharacterized repeat protein (TIGR01451 family)
LRRPRLLSVYIFGLVILGLATIHGELLAFAIPFVLYLGMGLLYRPEVVQLKASRVLSAERVRHDVPVTVTVSVTNEGAPIENLVLEDLVPYGLEVVDGSPSIIASLRTQETVEIQYAVSGRRGYYRLEGVRATASDNLLQFSEQRRLELLGRIFVLPQVFRLPLVAIRPRRTRVYAGLIPARRGGPGVEFFGVREYQPGDSLRWLNHRASARFEQTLFVNEFEQERAVDVGLILDTRQVTNLYASNRSLLEFSIQATATLSDSFLNRGNRVGMFMYGGFVDWTFPGYGKVQRERILQALARAQLQQSQVFEKLSYLPTRLFPIRSQLVLISPLRADDLEDLISLRARGYQLLIVSPDPVDFESRFLGTSREVDLAARLARLERAHLFHQLAQAGVRIFEWQVDKPFHQTARVALGRLPLWNRGPRR